MAPLYPCTIKPREVVMLVSRSSNLWFRFSNLKFAFVRRAKSKGPAKKANLPEVVVNNAVRGIAETRNHNYLTSKIFGNFSILDHPRSLSSLEPDKICQVPCMIIAPN